MGAHRGSHLLKILRIQDFNCKLSPKICQYKKQKKDFYLLQS